MRLKLIFILNVSFLLCNELFCQSLKEYQILPDEIVHEFIDLRDFLVLNNKIIASERVDASVIQFDLVNNNLTKFGGHGEGPGEFTVSPYTISFDPVNERLALADLSQSVINIFDNNLNPINKIIQNYPITSLSFSNNSRLIVGLPPINEFVNNIIIYDSNFNKLYSFPIVLNIYQKGWDLYNLEVCNNKNLIVVIFQYRNLIQIYSINGKLKKEIILEHIPDLAENIGGGREYLPKGTIFHDTTLDDNCNIYLLEGNHDTNNNRTVYKINITSNKIINTIFLENKATRIYHDNYNLYYLSPMLNGVQFYKIDYNELQK